MKNLQSSDGIGRRTSRDENRTVAHHASHLLASIAPPAWCRRNVVAQMPLSFVLDVECKDVV
jgi:hypothetical protein